jgi:hypothetical protein
VFLALIIVNHFFKDIFKLNPFYRNKILLEGFEADASVPTDSDKESTPTDSVKASTPTDSDKASTPTDSVKTSGETSSDKASSASVPTVSTPSGSEGTPIKPSIALESEMSETDKSTMMAELFEKVNNQMDIIRTLRLSDNFKPINIDKTVSDPFTILMNLKLLINNGIYKNEIDLKDMYDKYIGNKSVQLLTSEINSVNMDSSSNPNIGSLENTILVKTKNIVDGHQKIIDKLLEIKSNE